MLEQQVFKITQTELATPIAFAPKKADTLQFWVNYRKLNPVSMCGSYPILGVDEFIESLSEAAIYSTLVANSRYWNLEIEKPHREEIAFASHRGLTD